MSSFRFQVSGYRRPERSDEWFSRSEVEGRVSSASAVPWTCPSTALRSRQWVGVNRRPERSNKCSSRSEVEGRVSSASAVPWTCPSTSGVPSAQGSEFLDSRFSFSLRFLSSFTISWIPFQSPRISASFFARFQPLIWYSTNKASL